MSVDTYPVEDQSTFEGVFEHIMHEALEVLIERQKKYGPENINKAGLFGVVTRIEDKIERIKMGLNGRVLNGKIILDPMPLLPDEEPDDADIDLMNYAAIRIALRRGMWGKPLRNELNRGKR